MSSTHLDYLELTSYSDTPETPSSAQRMIAVVSTDVRFWNGTSWTTLGSGGGSGASTWEQLYANDNTFNVSSGNGFTLADASASANAAFTITKDAGSSGHGIQITQSGSGKDINGTSNTWDVTKAGVGTFAGLSVSGTSTALTTTGAAVWTVLDNSATSLRIGPSGGPVFLTFDTTNSAEVLSTDALTFQVTSGKTNLIQASNTISALVVTDNTITTFGASANSAGMAVFRSTSLTTGSLVQLQLTEATLNGGFYLTCRDVTGSANVMTVGEDGATTIAGAGGNTAFTITAGDAIMSDGSLAITDADDAASFSVTNNTATTASVVAIAGSGVFTGSTTTSFMTITPSGLTTGTAVYLPVAGLTTGKAAHIVANAITTGIAVHVASSAASTQLTGAGRLLKIDHTGNATGSGILSEFNSAAADETTIVKITASAALAAGVALDISGAAVTTGTLLDIGDADALTTGIVANFVTNSSDTGAHWVIYAKNDHASATGAVVAEFENDSTGSTVVIDHNGVTGKALFVDASSTTQTGGVIDISVAALTTGTVIDIGNLDAITTGKAILIDATGVTQTDGILVHVDSASTALTATGRLLLVDHTGNATASGAGILAEFKSAAADATTMVKITNAAAITGIGLDISLAGMTTGKAIDISNLDAITTGKALHIDATGVTQTDGILVHIDSASTALTSTGRLLLVDHTGNAGVSAVIAEVKSAAADETTIMKVTASAALAAGVAMEISGASVTTGTLLKISDANALTTGVIANLVSNSADTTARSLVTIKNDHASATGAIPLELINDSTAAPLKTTAGAVSTNFFRVGTFNGVTLWVGNGNTANTALSGTAGDIIFNAGSNKPEYCTGTTNWTALV